MKRAVLVLSGEGPYFKNEDYLEGTLFDTKASDELRRTYYASAGQPVALDRLVVEDEGSVRPLLRPKRGTIPHLTSFTLESILCNEGIDYEMFSLDHVWDGTKEPTIDPDIVLLSTTFICDRRTLRSAVSWVIERFPRAVLVLGGQYSNLKFEDILREYPRVDFIVRGDGEEALPSLVVALRDGGDIAEVPNLVCRSDSGQPRSTAVQYVDYEAYPSPRFPGHFPTVPYESMRGCPFRCKFCSFPFASPKWRFKSAAKIALDWRLYAEVNGATHIRALDSTFTVPPRRLEALFDLLPSVPVTWEAYARANAIRAERVVESLTKAGCTKLSLGFESMSDVTLGYMNKLVTAAENRRALDLLRDTPVGYRASFMAGYPGESPQEYERTHEFICSEFAGHFMLNVFSVIDETMPVWDDADRFELRVLDKENPDYAWTHVGMNSADARRLVLRTMDTARWSSDEAVLLLWQTDWITPLLPLASARVNLNLEKLIERLAFLPRDLPKPSDGGRHLAGLLEDLARHGIYLASEDVRVGKRSAELT